MLEPRLPAEIWVTIVEDLPPSSQRSCLSVSRSLHDIAIRPLFSVIRLYPCQNKGSRTEEILDRMVIDMAFGRLVKSLMVIIHSPESLDVLGQVVEWGKLAKAIESMSRLVSFQWVGTAVSFPEEVAEAISSFCPQLRELALPVGGTVYHAPLLNLHNLRALRASWLQFPFSDHPYIDLWSYSTHDFDLEGHLKMVDANQDTLRELHIITPYLHKVPVQIFDSLTHLEIYKPERDYISFQFLFRHANSLESLTLAGNMWFEFPVLGQDTDILPRLSSLYLWSFISFSATIWPSVSNLIRHRVSLRRLYLDLADCWSKFCEILPTIKDLPELRVLGLSTGDDDVNLEFLSHHLPPALESLHLELCWNGHTSSSPPHRVLESLPNLTFLHISDMLDSLPITAQEMAHDLKHLRIVGRQSSLWDIVRIGNDETLVPRNLPKREWRVDEDFPDEDSTWLLKYF